jgi:hypothetical protein
MKFTPASQNGTIPPTPVKSRVSKFGLIASKSTSTYGEPILLKALSDAALYKTRPVEFFDGATSLGTATWINTVSSVLLVNNLSTGSHSLYATWPGEGTYAGVSTAADPINLTVIAGAAFPGTLLVAADPASGLRVTGEGSVDVYVLIQSAQVIPGRLVAYLNNEQIGIEDIVNNRAQFTFTDLPAGNNIIKFTWPSGFIGGTRYEGLSYNFPYTVLRGTTASGNLVLSLNTNTGIHLEGNITLTASLTTSTSLPGNITFFADGEQFYVQPLTGNSSTYTIPNTRAIGTSTFSASWDGNQSSHPRYIEKTSNSVNYTVLARDSINSITLTCSPSPTAFYVNETYSAVISSANPLPAGSSLLFLADDQVLGSAPVVNNSATLVSRNITTGTHLIRAYYAGSTSEPKFYPKYSNTVTLVVAPGISVGAPLVLDVRSDPYYGTQAPYVKGERISLSAKFTTGLSIPYNGYFYFNNILGYTAPFVNNSATTSTIFTNTGLYDIPYDFSRSFFTISTASSGTLVLNTGTAGIYNIYAEWTGGFVDGQVYAPVTSTVTTITILDGYTMTQPITVSASNPKVISEPITYTASISTSSKMANTVTFYVNTLSIGSAQFSTVTNQAVLTTVAPVSSGTYTVKAIWSGGYIDDNRLYLGKESTTSSVFVDIGQRFSTGTFTVSHRTTGNNIVVTASLTNPPVFNGTDRGSVTFLDTATIPVINFRQPQWAYYPPEVVPGTGFYKFTTYANITVNDPIQLGITTSSVIAIRANALTLNYRVVNFVGTNTLVLENTSTPEGSYQRVPYTGIGVPSDDLPLAVNPGQTGFTDVFTALMGYTTTNMISYQSDSYYRNLASSIKIVRPQLTLGTSTVWVNNTASITIPISNLDPYTNTITAQYNGTNVIPKYYPATSNTTVFEKPVPIKLTGQLDAPDFYVNSEDGSSINSITTASLSLLYSNSSYYPTGRVTFFDGTSTLGTSTVSVVGGVPKASLSWNPATYNQINSGTRTLSAFYEGDVYNSTATSTRSWTATTRRDPKFTLSVSTQSAYSLQSTGTYYKSTAFKIDVQTTSTFLSGETINFYENNSLIGSSVVAGQTATFSLNTFNLSTGSHNVSARFSGNFAHNSTTTNTATYTLLAKGYVPITVSGWGDPARRVPASGTIKSTATYVESFQLGQSVSAPHEEVLTISIPETAFTPISIDIVNYQGEFLAGPNQWYTLYGSTVTTVVITATSVTIPWLIYPDTGPDGPYATKISTGSTYQETINPHWSHVWYQPGNYP